MKKLKFFTVLICSLLMLVPNIFATEWSVVKQNNTAYIFKIENYGETNMYVITTVLVNPGVNDLVALKLPKEAWNYILRISDGTFDTISDKQAAKIQTLEKEKLDLINDLGRAHSTILIMFSIFLGLSVIIIISTIFYSLAPKKNKTEEPSDKSSDIT